uniref:Uncharacterized protein n=1 Tax=Anguilla anguilla TaxID=7936 RepID=A0A0E9PSZ0_ANGAN
MIVIVVITYSQFESLPSWVIFLSKTQFIAKLMVQFVLQGVAVCAAACSGLCYGV